MEKLTRQDGSSPDLVADTVEKLKAIVPEAFADGHLDLDALKQTLGEYVDDREERYSFTWHGKSRARQIAQIPSTGTLLPCPEESVDWDTTKNIFIEGDNLEVLKLLQKSYHRKVKMIYIDPPYNTGKEFIYPDKWQDNLDTYLRYTGQIDDEGFKLSANAETSGRYHTNWLNMMYPRLKLARNLLADDGVIVVSIDDNEIHNLRHLLDELFGPENFLTAIVWQKAYVANMTAKHVSATHDYLLVYARNEALAKVGRMPRTKEQIAAFKNPDSDPRGPWKAENLSAGKFYSAGQFSIRTPSGDEVSPPPGRYWRCNEATYEQWLAEGRITFGSSGTGRPMLKKYLSEVRDGLTPETWWPHKLFGSNKQATTELKLLFDGVQTFDTPKPVLLMTWLLRLFAPDGGLVLDFFGGSGSLAAASLRLGAESEASWPFLIVQLPEPTGLDSHETVSDMAIDRLKREISALETSRLGELPTAEGATDFGIKVFRLAASNIKPWDAEFDSMENDLLEAVDNIKSDRSEDDVLCELLLKYGLDLAIPSEARDIDGRKVTVIGAGALIVCLADDITPEVVTGIAALKDELKPEVMRVVFKDSGFADDVAKTNAAQILKQAGIDDVKSL